MKKLINSFVFLFLITILSYSNVLAINSTFGFGNKSLVLAPPLVTTPVYLCQNSVATPLTATPTGGGTLTWYSGSTGGTALPGAPTPITSTVGSTTYYVTETIAGIESSPRTPIVVNVVADTGGVLTLFCDAANTKPTSVAFDWNNVTGYLGYNYSYSVAGGPLVTGFQVAPSHFDVPVPGPGTSVTFTILSVLGLPCVKPISVTCNSTCTAAQIIAPNFAPIPSFCSGTPAPILPATSLEGISGTWSPATISNTNSGNYVFTPNPILFPCALTKTLSVTVTPMVAPTFSGIPAVVCQGTVAPVLPLISSNTSPITGTWSPPTVDTSTLGTTLYTFTPTLGQSCVSTTLTTTSIRIDPVLTPTFTPVTAICSGATLLALPTTSIEGITGTWSPAINNMATTIYTFTPTAGQCANSTTMTVVVNLNVTPTFTTIAPICSGNPLAALPIISNNGINGSWSPALNNTTTTTYTFVPTSGQCAATTTMTIVVNPRVEPDFVDLSICSGTIPPNLDTTSPNGITGTWSPSIIDNTTSAAYVFTPDASQCAIFQQTINVTVNPSDALQSITWTVTDAFSNNQIVTITATGTGNYLYQMDSGPFQTSPVFENVASGLHSITVEDVNGCSLPITENNILVIGYPKFFTPNGDAYNDTWNVVGLNDQLNSKIYIFDRYGKLLKDISPKSTGWDGTYIGQQMPAADYWFTVEYEEQGITKKFKSHFALKR